MYLINVQFIRPVAAVQHFIDAHIAFLEKQYKAGNFVFSGMRKPLTGGMILCNCKSRREVEAILAEDPFDKNQIAVYDIVEIEPHVFEYAGADS
jgi:uncharacterized protein YciI